MSDTWLWNGYKGLLAHIVETVTDKFWLGSFHPTHLLLPKARVTAYIKGSEFLAMQTLYTISISQYKKKLGMEYTLTGELCYIQVFKTPPVV